MSKKSNNHGRAYEYIFLVTLCEAINQKRSATIDENSSYKASFKAWNTLSKNEMNLYKISAESTIDTLFALEPNITEKTKDDLLLYIQPDQRGEEADVRDIIIKRNDLEWEIGLSIKHNHMATKHSRLSKNLDFGKKWYEVPCSNEYWEEVKQVFAYLERHRDVEAYFRDLPNKEDNIYIPLLKAFMTEVERQVKKHKSIPRKLVEYLLSKYDFYKVVSMDRQGITTIQSFNMYGTLNLPSEKNKPKISIPIMDLPSELLHIDFKPESKTTIIMCFDKGWQFSFRIHNARDIVEPSLKFDIRIEGIPAISNLKFNCKWISA